MRVEIKSPCPITWNPGEGCAKTRFCHLCSKKVHNLSNMTPAAAEQIVARRDAGEEVCVSFYADKRGNLMFKRAVATATMAAGLFQAQVALADGSTTVLVPVDPVASTVIIAAVEPVETAAETDADALVENAGALVSQDVLTNVDDEPCDGDQQIEATNTDGELVELDQIYFLGGV